MSGALGLGKVTREVFDRSVGPFLPLGEEPGLDGATVALTGKTVVSHSPSIGVPPDALGFFAFHYAACNVACRFGRPTHMVAGIYLPLKSSEEDLRTITCNLGDEAKRYGVRVVAGQTAAYYGLEIPLVSTTCLGEALRPGGEPSAGDLVVLVGEVGGESVWLQSLARGSSGEDWRSFTGLDVLLALGELPGVELLHDVSEGGLLGALGEMVRDLGLGLSFESGLVPLATGVSGVGTGALRAPTYGAVLAVVKEDAQAEAEEVCGRLGRRLTVLGKLEPVPVLRVDGAEVTGGERGEIDEIYGSFRERDEVISVLEEALAGFVEIAGVERLIPEVGFNMVYARPGAESMEEVAGLTGRVVNASGEPMACGRVAYGGSRFMAGALLAALRLDPSRRAAAVVRGDREVADALAGMGLRVRELPPTAEAGACPVETSLRAAPAVADAYYHPGAFGIEPTTTILSSDPRRLLETLKELAGLV